MGCSEEDGGIWRATRNARRRRSARERNTDGVGDEINAIGMMGTRGDRERLAAKVGTSEAGHECCISNDRSKHSPLSKVRNLRRGGEGEIRIEGIAVTRTSELPEEPNECIVTCTVPLDDSRNEARANATADLVQFIS